MSRAVVLFKVSAGGVRFEGATGFDAWCSERTPPTERLKIGYWLKHLGRAWMAKIAPECTPQLFMCAKARRTTIATIARPPKRSAAARRSALQPPRVWCSSACAWCALWNQSPGFAQRTMNSAGCVRCTRTQQHSSRDPEQSARYNPSLRRMGYLSERAAPSLARLLVRPPSRPSFPCN